MLKTVASAGLIAAILSGCSTDEIKSEPYAFTESALRYHVETLSSDAFGGRAPGTAGEELTLQYLEGAFRDMGLAPANGDSYLQEVPLVSIETQDNPVLTLRGGTTDHEFKYRADQVIWTRREDGASLLDESELVFVGYGINAPERGWNDYEDVDVSGKTVVILVNDPGFATQDDSLFNGNAMTYYGRWTYKFDEAARQGAAGALIIHETAPAAYPWATVDSSWTGPQFGAVRADKGSSLAAVEGWISTDTTDKIFAAAGLERAALSRAALSADFKAVPMNMTVSTNFTNDINHVTSYNVAAVLPGGEVPDETFIYMAHWDHLGMDPTIEGDNIYNGALDNATGTGGLLELARKYAAAPDKPRRSVMFLSVTAEEQGLLGSAYYAANPLRPLADTVGGLNMDGLNYFGPTSDVSIVGLGNSELDDIIGAAALEQGRTLTADAEPEKGYFYRSDHFELAKFGVPMVYPGSGTVHKEKGKAFVDAVTANYLANNYHKPSDEVADDWTFDGAVEDLELYYTTGRRIVDTNIWPNWRDGNEFKAARDKQRGAQMDKQKGR